METQTQIKQVKQRKTMRYFETYISRVLREVSHENGIKSNAKQQLNSILCIICEEISKLCTRLTRMSKKKTLSVKEVDNAVRIIMVGELAKNSTMHGMRAVENFNDTNCKHTSRQNKADIIFPPSITEKYLRNFEMSRIMVTGDSPIYLAAVMEYLCYEILDIACNITIEYKRKRISVRDLKLSIKNDFEINALFVNMGLSFLGGGVVPHIHPILFNKRCKKKKQYNIPLDHTAPAKKHRFRPGTVALREIRKYQRSSNPLFAKQPFDRLVRNIVNKCNPEMKIGKDVFIIMQYFIEQYITDFLYTVGLASIHAGRVKIVSSDISFVCMCRNMYNPTNTEEQLELLSISDQDSNLDDIEDIENIINGHSLQDHLDDEDDDTEDDDTEGNGYDNE